MRKKIGQLTPHGGPIDPTMKFEVELAGGQSRFLTGAEIIDYIVAQSGGQQLSVGGTVNPSVGVELSPLITRELPLPPATAELGLQMAAEFGNVIQFSAAPSVGVEMAAIVQASGGDPLAIDGQAVFTNSNEGNIQVTGFSTSGANRLIVACIFNIGSSTFPNVTGVSGASLTFTRRIQVQWNGSGTQRCNLEIWTAPAASQLTSQTFTVTLNPIATIGSTVRVMGIQGADLTTPLDTNASSIKSGSNPSSTATQPSTTGYSTNAADTITIVNMGTSEVGVMPSAGTGWTAQGLLNAASPSDGQSNVFRRINSTTFNNATLNWASGTSTWWGYGMITVRKAGG